MQQAVAYTGSEIGLDISHGESAAQELDEVLSRCRPSLYRSADRFLGNAADAEDAVQDALLSACKHLDQFRGQAQISTWLTAIVSNSARRQGRKRLRHLHISLDEPIGKDQEYSISERVPDLRPNPEDECQNSELHARLTELVTQLSPPLRKTFQLRELDGRTTSEAACILGVAGGTVKAQLTRARLKLRRLMRRALDPQRHGCRTSTALASMAEK